MPQKLKAGKRTAKEIKELINASYSNEPPERIGKWVLDKQLSTDTAKVYYNPKTGEANVIHRGTAGASDWLNNASYVLGTYENTDRYKQGKKVQQKAEKKYGADNISTLGHSQGAVLSRKLGKDTKEIINVNPAYKGEKELKNEYNIRSKTDVVSGAKGLVDLVAPSKKTTTVSSKNPLDILGEHSPDILDRLGNKSVGAGKNIIFSNNIMKGGRRVSNLNYTGEDIDWYNGGLLPESAYQNIGKTPIGVIGGERHQSSDSESDEEMVGGDIFKSISKGVKKLGKSVSKGVEKGTEAIGKTVAPITKGVEKATEAMSKVTDKINPMTYALDSKPISKAMGSLGEVTNDYLLPAVVQAGKPIYDAAAMAASTAITGNPVLGKVAADTLWNEMVAKKGIDPRQNQKSELLGELATTAGKTAAAEAGGSRRRKGKMRGGVLKRDFVERLDRVIRYRNRWIDDGNLMGYSEGLINDFNEVLNNLKLFLRVLRTRPYSDDDDLPNDVEEVGLYLLSLLPDLDARIRVEDYERPEDEDEDELPAAAADEDEDELPAAAADEDEGELPAAAAAADEDLAERMDNLAIQRPKRGREEDEEPPSKKRGKGRGKIKGGGGGASTLQNDNLTPIINYLTLQQLTRLPRYKRAEYIDIIRDIVSNFINQNLFYIEIFNVRQHQRKEFSIPELDAIVDETITISDDGESKSDEDEDEDEDDEEIRTAESTNGSGRKGKMRGGVLKRNFIVLINTQFERWRDFIAEEQANYSEDLYNDAEQAYYQLEDFRDDLRRYNDNDDLPNDIERQGNDLLARLVAIEGRVHDEDLAEQMDNLEIQQPPSKRRRGNGRGKIKGGSRKILQVEIHRLNEIMNIDDDSGYFKNVYKMTPKQIARAFSFICIEILPNTPKGVLINQENVRRWVRRANTLR